MTQQKHVSLERDLLIKKKSSCSVVERFGSIIENWLSNLLQEKYELTKLLKDIESELAIKALGFKMFVVG